MTKPAAGSANLKPRARILRTFGDELISSETVAVIELVKNSYDADASRVHVRFREPLEVGQGALDVIDDGHGMTTETVTTVWMEPATMFRASERRSEKLGRRVLGEKGIGRFAASRLADRLSLTTRRPDSDLETTALFDWSQFDDPEKFLADVEVLWEETEPREVTGGHGTVLQMEGLRADWDRGRLETLNRGLSRLISPFATAGGGGPEDFRIQLDVPGEFSDLSGEIGPVEALQNPEYLLRGSIAADGSYEFELRVGRDSAMEKLSGELRVGDRSLPTCGPFDLELRAWDRDALHSVAKEQGLGVRDFKRELDDFSGVSIYRDGFRVFPYGEKGDDWLGLDPRRVNQPTRRISNNQIAGYVSIAHEENRELRDQTNREGLMQNRAYEDLKDLILGALQLLEEPRWKWRKPDRGRAEDGPEGDGQSGGDPFESFDLGDLRDTVRDKAGSDPDIEGAFDQKQKDFETGVDEVRELLGSYTQLASLGRLVDAILHDGRAPLAAIDADAELGLRKIERAKRDDDPVTEYSSARLSRIRQQTRVLDALFRRIAPFAGRKRGRPKKLVLEELVRETFDLEESKINEMGIRLSLPTSTTEVTVEETDLRIVLYNLTDNALHWLRDVPADSREIEVQVSRHKDETVEILFSDSGPGVSEEDRAAIFEPYFSRKLNGWGIGLSQAGGLIKEHYDGSLGLAKEGPLPGATFSVVLRRRI